MTQKEIKQVVVVGGGLAGLMTCFWLQRFGIPHVLIEKKTFPREKACADIITSKVIRRINEINADFIPDMLSKGFLFPIYGTDISYVNNHSLRLNFKSLNEQSAEPSCYSVKREELDHYLLKKVLESPLTEFINAAVSSVKSGKDVCLLTTKEGKVLQTNLLIVATGSGVNPMLSEERSSKEEKHNALGIRAYYKGINCEANFCYLILDKKLFPGGFYITTMANDTYNVNLVVRSDVQKKNNLNLRDELESLITNNPVIKEKFKNATRVSDYAGSNLRLATKKRSVSGERYMMAGDAAGLIDIISANGIPQAMISGKLSAEFAKKCIDANDFSGSFLKQYDKALFNLIKSDISVGKFLNPVLSVPIVKKMFLNFAKFLTRKSSRRSSLEKLFYDKKPVRLLFSPRFYFNIFRETKS